MTYPSSRSLSIPIKIIAHSTEFFGSEFHWTGSQQITFFEIINTNNATNFRSLSVPECLYTNTLRFSTFDRRPINVTVDIYTEAEYKVDPQFLATLNKVIGGEPKAMLAAYNS